MNKELIFKVLEMTLAVIAGIILLIFGGLYYIFGHICDKELVGTYKSPDGIHEARYEATRCGAISEDVGHIILDGKEVVRVRLGALKVRWNNNQILDIEYSGIKVAKLVKEYKGIKIDLNPKSSIF